jgi:hypothetical protein
MLRARWIVGFEDSTRRYKLGYARTRRGRDALILEAQVIVAHQGLIRVVVSDLRRVQVAIEGRAGNRRRRHHGRWPGES